VVVPGQTDGYSEPRHEISFDPDSILSRIDADSKSRIRSIAAAYRGVDEGSLLKQLSIHLPRLTFEENNSAACVMREAERLADRLASLRREYLDSVPEGSRDKLGINDLVVEPIEDDQARPILERFHYLLSHRQHSLHFGLRKPGSSSWPVAVVSLSGFDLSNLQSSLPAGSGSSSLMVVSRVYAFNPAPPNSISFLLARVRQWLAINRPAVGFLVTYLNPNVGFSGSSYRADNWTRYGEESDTRYIYLDSDYKTDRWLADSIGTSDLAELRKRLGNRVSASLFRLRALEIYVRSAENRRIPDSIHTFHRWSPTGEQ
jgi:hypothetical protein